jgi:hypothetical protein
MSSFSRSQRFGIYSFIGLAIIVTIAALLAPRTDLPASYHHFADTRSWLGIPNFGDVASNLLFLVAGIWGLFYLSTEASRSRFADTREKWPYFFVFIGLVWTAFGSGYYYLAPDNQRLVWDRLPMIFVFMPFVAALIAERVSGKVGFWSLPILTAIGVASVFQWRESFEHGSGDIRFYAAVQLYAAAALIAALFLPSRYTRRWDLIWVAIFYAIAKIAEMSDHQIFAAGRIISGHTIKHLAAGAAGLAILRILQTRSPCSLAEKTL